MTFGEYFRVAWEALVANKLRSILTMIGIIIGVGSVVAVVTIGQGAQGAILDAFKSLGADSVTVFSGSATQPPNKLHIEPITPDDLGVLSASLPQAKAIAPTVNASTTFRAGANQVSEQLLGLTPAYLAALPVKVASGRALSEQDERSAAPVLVLGTKPAKTLFPDLADPTGQTVYVGGYPFSVVGVLGQSTGFLSSLGVNYDNIFFAPFSVVQRLSGQRNVYQVQIMLGDKADPKTTGADAVAILKRLHPKADFDTFSLGQIGESLSKVTSIATVFIAAVAGISLLVGGIGIMNIMLVSVTERTREIGIRKALGARHRDVLWQFIIEAILVSLVGGTVGVLLALVPMSIVSAKLHISVLLNLKAVALAVGVSVGVGLIFGVYPANKAARMDPIDALRYE